MMLNPASLPPDGRPQPARANAIRCTIAAAGIALLVACGGGGGGGSSTTPPPPPPPPGPTSATSYYLSGESGGASGHPYVLTGVEPASGGTVPIPSTSLYSSTLATIGEWTAANASATSVGTRYRVWSGSDGNIYSTDLGVLAGSTAPTTVQLSNFPAAHVCASPPPTVINDLASPANSAVVFRDSSAGGCGNPTDRFVSILLSTGAAAAPVASGTLEPVDAVRDSTGKVVKVLFLDHSTSPASVSVASSVSAVPTKMGQIQGSGLNYAGGDFQSLAIVPQTDGSYVWLYRDFKYVYAVNLNSPTVLVQVFAAQDSDDLQQGVVVDGPYVYVATTDPNNPDPLNPGAFTCQVIWVDTRTLTPGSGVIALHEDTTGAGLSLVGVVGGNIVYLNDNSANGAGTQLLEYIPKNSNGLTAPAGTIDMATLPTTSFDKTSQPISVGSGLYYAIDTPAGSSAGQAYYYDGMNLPSSPIGLHGSIVLGGARAASVPTTSGNTPAFSSAILALLPLGGNLPGSTIASFGASGAASEVDLGVLSTLGQGDSYAELAVSEASLQTGMPALLKVSGLHKGNTAQDLYEIIPGKAASLHQVTNNLQ